MKIPFAHPTLDSQELKSVKKVLDSGVLVHGKKTIEFENLFKKFTNAKNALTVSSCTAGMHLIYFTLGYGPGDEVIVPAQTHISTAHAVELTGAKPVFVDADQYTGNIDIDKIEKSINKKTKAISVVHYLGIPVDMKRIMKIAKKHKLFVLEDCALALGSYNQGIHMGLMGDIGVFSFYPVKHITTAEGGMIISKKDTLIQKLKLKKAFGVDKNFKERKIPGLYDAITLGLNYRMSELSASLGVEQMKKLDLFLKKRSENFKILSNNLNEIDNLSVISVQKNNLNIISSNYCLSILLKDKLKHKRTVIMKELLKKKIGCSIYYPQPVPRMTYYKKKYGYDKNDFPNAAMFSDQTIALPVGPHLKKNQIKYISEELKKIIKKI